MAYLYAVSSEHPRYKPLIVRRSIVFLVFIAPFFLFAQITPRAVNSTHGKVGFFEFKPQGYNPDSTYDYPLIIMLHGVGERGNGGSDLHMVLNSSFARMVKDGASMKFTVNGRKHAFLVLIPQMAPEYENWQNFYIDAMIDYARDYLKVDTNKIFLSGWSLGGGGAWKYPTSSIDSAKRIAGVVLVAPSPDYANLCNLARGKVAVWAHHARDDSAVPLHFTEDAINSINACSPEVPALISYYPSGGHPYVAAAAYDTLNRFQYPNMFQWMIGITRSNSRASNEDPVASAGTDTTLVVPSLRTILNGSGSYDPNDVIVSYEWTLVNGPRPAGFLIHKPKFPCTEVSGLQPGAYTFRLTVKDEFAVVKWDEVTLNVILPPKGVNATPFIEAGPEITTSSLSYHLSAGAKDYDGKITRYHWRQVSGPVPVRVLQYGNVANVLGMTATGKYGIEVSAFDNHTAAGKDTLMINKNEPLPVVIFYWAQRSNHGKTNYTPFVVLFILLIFLTKLSGLHFAW